MHFSPCFLLLSTLFLLLSTLFLQHLTRPALCLPSVVAVALSVPGTREVRGSDTSERKEIRLAAFSEKLLMKLVTKPSIAGFGLNWQSCHNMIFVGLSDSYELLYQAIRRCWRFGQDHTVNVYIIISTAEGAVRENIERKDEQCKQMVAEMVKHTKEILSKEIRATVRMTEAYEPRMEMVIPAWIIEGGYAV